MRVSVRGSLIISLSLTCSMTRLASAEAAEYELKPRITVSEEYNDNINETRTDRQEEFVTRAMPGFSLLYKAPRLVANTDYNFEYVYYANGSNAEEYNNTLRASGTLGVVENFFFIEASDTYRRVSLDASRDTTYDTLYTNYSDQNIATVSPYFVWRPGEKSTIRTGYRYTNTWYKESDGIDKQEHYAFIDASHELLPKFSLTWGYSYTDLDSTDKDSQRHTVYGGFRYEYAERSFLYAQGGNTWQSFNDGEDISDVYWNAGLSHDAGIAVLTLETRVQYTEDPQTSSNKETRHFGRISRTLERGNLAVWGSHSEFEIVETGEIDTRKLTIGGTGRYELLENTNIFGSLIGDHYSTGTIDGYPYWISGTAGVSYGFNNDLTLTMSYNHITYRYSVDDTTGGKEINRAVLALSKSF